MPYAPLFSLIVPTRGRPAQLARFLQSVAATATHPETIEVVLVVDADDPASHGSREDRLCLREVVVPPGLRMGQINAAGYRAATGEYVMLLNDDVVVRTPGWDLIARRCLKRFPDPIVLVHVNDTLIKDYLCTFPMVSRRYCELAGGICPESYRRYRIDDHIEDPFNLMAFLGVRRSIYLPDVVFEHTNAVEHAEAGRVYQSDPEILALDAPEFDRLFEERKQLALRLLEEIEGKSDPNVTAERLRLLATVNHSLELRIKGRQHLCRTLSWWRTRAVWQWHLRQFRRLRKVGLLGLPSAILRKVLARRQRSVQPTAVALGVATTE